LVGEDVYRPPGQAPGLVAEAAIEKWLSATGLAGREHNLVAGPPEQANARHADLGHYLVHNAGGKEGHLLIFLHAGAPSDRR
jgi:hypothetical protein